MNDLYTIFKKNEALYNRTYITDRWKEDREEKETDKEFEKMLKNKNKFIPIKSKE